MHLQELFPQVPTWFGATDACGHKLGGVFFDASGTPYVWQLLLLPHIQRNLRTADNTHGCLSMNALKLAAHVTYIPLKSLGMKFLEHTLDGTDSTAALSWNNKGSISSNGVEAQLLVWKARYQRHSGIVSLGKHVPRWLNDMADKRLAPHLP